jgi:hypothetical protein
MQAVYTKIITWLNALTPADCTVIIADQNAPTPPRPFVTVKLRVTGDVARDFSADVRDLSDTGSGAFPGPDPEFVRDVVRFLRLTCDVQVFGDPAAVFEAETIAQGILDHAYNSDAALDVFGRNLAFQLVLSEPQTVDAVIGTEFEPRVTMALQFSATRDLVYEIGGISTVIVEGSAGAQQTESEATWQSA